MATKFSNYISETTIDVYSPSGNSDRIYAPDPISTRLKFRYRFKLYGFHRLALNGTGYAAGFSIMLPGQR